MFGSGVLDTAIGLVFVFLLVSVLVTIANEMIASLTLARAKWLQFGIERLLDSDWAKRLYAHPLISGSAASTKQIEAGRPWRGSGPSYIASRSFANVLLDLVHQEDRVVKAARTSLQGALDAAREHDAPAAELAQALVGAVDNSPLGQAIKRDLAALLATSGRPATVGDAVNTIQRFIDSMPTRYLRAAIEGINQEQISKTLLVLLDDAQNDLDRFKQNVEVWFNNGMDRVGGWYKRRSQNVVCVLALGIVVVLNVDALAIVRHLDVHPGMRDALVAQAKAFADKPPAAAASVVSPASPASPASAASAASEGAADPAELVKQYGDVQKQLAQLGLPIGWVTREPEKTGRDETYRLSPFAGGPLLETVRFHFFGWLITALAATLGAPFWFDTLNRLMAIRSAGKAPEEKPKPPKEVPVPLEPGQSPREADALSARRPGS